jgi:hypothetical protein
VYTSNKNNNTIMAPAAASEQLRTSSSSSNHPGPHMHQAAQYSVGGSSVAPATQAACAEAEAAAEQLEI